MKINYQQRRQQLASKLANNSIAIIASANNYIRNGDSSYRFRQDSNFYYLTGINEPNAVLLIEQNGTSYLFNQVKNPQEEQWSGYILGQEAAIALGFSYAFSYDDLEQRLPELLIDKQSIYYPISHDLILGQKIIIALQKLNAKIRHGVNAPGLLVDLIPIISETRLIKEPAELSLMQQAIDISIEAHRSAMINCRRLNYEYQLEAILRYELAYHGCRALAYEPIVGNGENACILHYIDNDQPLETNNLVLIDAGGEFENYAADISRTFPINGKFTHEQKQIYSLVLTAQRQAIAMIKPGLAWNEIQNSIINTITQGLCSLGILQGDVAELINTNAYKKFYMHGSGHWLGLDVHDCGAYKIDNKWRELQAGMVLTVEPGIYIKQDDSVDKKWHNIGVRIEDDILVTADGHENLSKKLAVEIDDIEALVSA